MIKLCTLKDVEKIKKLELRKYLCSIVKRILKGYELSKEESIEKSIEEYGPVYLIDSKEELQNLESIGLSQPLEDEPFEWVEDKIIGDNTFYNIVIVINNDYAINIVVSKQLLTREQLQAVEENMVLEDD